MGWPPFFEASCCDTWWTTSCKAQVNRASFFQRHLGETLGIHGILLDMEIPLENIVICGHRSQAARMVWLWVVRKRGRKKERGYPRATDRITEWSSVPKKKSVPKGSHPPRINGTIPNWTDLLPIPGLWWRFLRGRVDRQWGAHDVEAFWFGNVCQPYAAWSTDVCVVFSFWHCEIGRNCTLTWSAAAENDGQVLVSAMLQALHMPTLHSSNH